MRHRLWQIWWTFTRLGLTSFGGPTAHIGYFHHEFVTRRGWLSNDEFAQDNALCQLVPGPASSQLGMLIGSRQAGVWGAIVAWVGFTTPSAVIMLLVMQGSRWLESQTGLIHGLLLGAACVVTHAVWSMARTFCLTRPQQLIAGVTLGLLLISNSPWVQLSCLVGAAVCGAIIHQQHPPLTSTQNSVITRTQGTILLVCFVGLVLISTFITHPLTILFQSGALVFGGGHVVLPLIQQRLVASGAMQSTQILSGYATAQLLPGPLFAIGAYVGGVAGGYSWVQGVLGIIAIFLPGLLLIMGIMPWWQQIQQQVWVQRALRGVQAGVVGILAATLWDPIMTHTLTDKVSVAIWGIGTALLIYFKWPAWVITGLCAGIGLLFMHA